MAKRAGGIVAPPVGSCRRRDTVSGEPVEVFRAAQFPLLTTRLSLAGEAAPTVRHLLSGPIPSASLGGSDSRGQASPTIQRSQ